MLETLQGIVLETRRHTDRHNVVTLYTRSRGRVAFLSPAGTSKTARLRQARLQPLAVIETCVNFKENKDLQLLGDFHTVSVGDSLRFHPVKGAVVQFIAEFLLHLLRTSPPDPTLWDYLVGSFTLYNNSEKGVGNFHLALLVSLLPFMGIQPDLTIPSTTAWFDMQGGTFSPVPPLHNHYLLPDEARLVPLFSRMNFANYTRFRLNGSQRRRLLALLLEYYSLHLPGMGGLKSPEILAEVFGTP